MKKILILSAVVIAVLATLAVAGYAYAQTQPPATPFPYGPGGMMGGWGGRTGGMMGGRGGGMMGGQWNGQYGPMHQYMIDAVAQAFEMTPEDLQARLNKGDTFWTIAQEKGLTQEQFNTLMKDASAKALKQAVEAGALTQEQADWMQQHMNQMGGFGGGFGPCHDNDDSSYGPGRGPGRQNSRPAQPNS